jgi:hypothetical protein
LGFEVPGLKIRVFKENSFPAPVLEGEGRVYMVLFFGVLAYNGFLAREPREPPSFVRKGNPDLGKTGTLTTLQGNLFSRCLSKEGSPENTQNDVFLGAFNGFLAGEPRLGCRKMEKWISGFFRASGNQKYTQEKFPRPEECPAH